MDQRANDDGDEMCHAMPFITEAGQQDATTVRNKSTYISQSAQLLD